MSNLLLNGLLQEPRGILYPDFTFYSWPESTCPPNEKSHDYSDMAIFVSMKGGYTIWLFGVWLLIAEDSLVRVILFGVLSSSWWKIIMTGTVPV